MAANIVFGRNNWSHKVERIAIKQVGITNTFMDHCLIQDKTIYRYHGNLGAIWSKLYTDVVLRRPATLSALEKCVPCTTPALVEEMPRPTLATPEF